MSGGRSKVEEGDRRIVAGMEKHTRPVGHADARRLTTANKIVCFWVGSGLLAVPAAFLGWRYSLGILAGMLFAGLWAWRYDHVR